MQRAPTSAVVVSGLAAALTGLDGGSFGPALPALRSGLHLDDARAAWLLSAYVLGTLLGNPGNAWICARRGARFALSFGTGVYALGALAMALSHDAPLACIARFTQGLGAGSLLAIATATVAQRAPADRRGRSIMALSLVYALAFLGASIAASWIGAAAWRAIYVALGLVAAGASIYTATSLEDTAPEGPAPLDPRGLALWIATVAALAVIVPQIRGGTLRASTIAPALAAVIALFAASVVSARRVAEPFVPLALLRVPSVRAACVLSLGAGVGQVFAVSLPSYAAVVLGVEPARLGVWSLPFVLAGIAGTVVAAAVIDRLGARRVVQLTALALAIGALALATTPPSRVLFAALSAVMGVGICTLSGGPIRHLVGVVEGPDGPRAQALLALVVNLGLLASSGVWAALASPTGDLAMRAAGMRHGVAVIAVIFAVMVSAGLSMTTRER